MNSFTIRLHEAGKAGRHHDLHLNGDSWAVPKGVPTVGGPKVLAIRTWEHSPEERHFEGTISEGQYGAGTSEVIDEGKLQIIRQSPTYISFKLLGNSYRGNYYLKYWHHNHWLLWKA